MSHHSPTPWKPLDLKIGKTVIEEDLIVIADKNNEVVCYVVGDTMERLIANSKLITRVINAHARRGR